MFKTSEYVFINPMDETVKSHIDCPACKKAKLERYCNLVFTSNPPKYKYKCPECDHIDYFSTTKAEFLTNESS